MCSVTGTFSLNEIYHDASNQNEKVKDTCKKLNIKHTAVNVTKRKEKEASTCSLVLHPQP